MNNYGISSPTKNNTRTSQESDLSSQFDFPKANIISRREQDNGFSKAFAAAPGTRMFEMGGVINVQKDLQRFHSHNYGSSSNSPMMNVYEPTSSSYWRSNPNESENWSNDKEDRNNIPPIGTGSRKKPKDTFDQRNFEEAATNYLFELQANRLNESNSIYEGSMSIDFLAEGEKMVSELCSSFDTSENKWPPSNIYKTFNFENKFDLTAAFDPKNRMVEKSKVLIADYEKLHEKIPNEIVQLAVEACTDAENIAIAHHHRPCFKNIHSICAKTRSNVQKPDSAVANLHSQGVPWVIKNFIFSFVRILDGWKGVKELLNEKHDSFSRIENQYYSPEIRECFVEWQVVTKDMLSHIYKTYKCLHEGFILEQKSFTQYHSIARQNKFQQTKNNPSNISRISTPGSTSSTSWFQSYTHSEQSWQQMRSNATTKKVFPAPPILNTNNFIPFPESVNMPNKSNIKSEQGLHREIKARQTWTLSQAAEYASNLDQREYLAQLRQNMDAENSKGIISQSSLNNEGEDIEQRKAIDMKAKMIPVSQVERNMVPNTANPCESATVKIKCCGDAKEDADSNWRQVIQKDSNEYFMQNTSSQSSNVISFSSSNVGSKVYEKGENDDIYSLPKSKVYMKPGSYNIPIKLADVFKEDNDNVEKEIVDGSKQSNPISSTLEFEAVNVMWSFFEDKPPKTTAMQFKYPEPGPSVGVQTDFSNIAAYDKDWEAAKQSVTKVMDGLNDGNSEAAKLDNIISLSKKGSKHKNDSETEVSEGGVISKTGQRCENKNLLSKNYYSENNKPFTKSGKKKTIPPMISDKFEKIILALTKMNDASLIEHKMDSNYAPQFYEVVKHPLSLKDISVKLANSSYSDTDQVVKDFRKIFSNLRLYLKMYPDTSLRKKINKLSNEFERIIQEDFPDVNLQRGSLDESKAVKMKKLLS